MLNSPKIILMSRLIVVSSTSLSRTNSIFTFNAPTQSFIGFYSRILENNKSNCKSVSSLKKIVEQCIIRSFHMVAVLGYCVYIKVISNFPLFWPLTRIGRRRLRTFQVPIFKSLSFISCMRKSLYTRV